GRVGRQWARGPRRCSPSPGRRWATPSPTWPRCRASSASPGSWPRRPTGPTGPGAWTPAPRPVPDRCSGSLALLMASAAPPVPVFACWHVFKTTGATPAGTVGSAELGDDLGAHELDGLHGRLVGHVVGVHQA